MEITLDKLPKDLLQNDPHERLGRRLLNSARKDTVNFLLNTPLKQQGMGKSGYLIDSDKELVERITKCKVYESHESGEMFYRLVL